MTPYERVIAASRGLLAHRLATGTAGNVSERLDAGHVLVTPSAVPYDDLTPDDLVVLDGAGTVVAGRRTPTSEWALHLALYRRFPEIGAVLHSHPPYASAFAAARRPIPAVIDELVLYVGGDVPCAAYAPSGSAELGELAADVLGDVGSALLANHGMVTVAADALSALHQAGVVEHAAQVALGSERIGGPAAVPAEAVAAFAERYRRARSLPTT